MVSSASADAEACDRTRQPPSARSRPPRNSPFIVAVDLPSGIDADTGEVAGPAVHADVTVTFGTYKPGLLISPGAEHVGDLRFVDIGLAPYLEGGGDPVLEALEPADVEALLPTASAESNKYRRGVVGLAAGSPRYPGAAVLATGAALRSGVGAVRFVGESEVSDGVLARYPEVMVGQGRVQAWVVGPGIGPDGADRVAEALAAEVPVLVDADGLAALAALKPSDRDRTRPCSPRIPAKPPACSASPGASSTSRPAAWPPCANSPTASAARSC